MRNDNIIVSNYFVTFWAVFMKEVYSFLVRKMNSNGEEADKLAQALSGFGIQVKFEDASFMDDDDYSKLTFMFDESELEQRRTRNAGIKVKYSDEAYDETFGSVKLRLESETHEAVAKSLGMSRMTLYRKLKKAEDTGIGDDFPIYLL